MINLGGEVMATSSIMRNVRIKDQKLVKNLVVALENAKETSDNKVQLKRPYNEMKPEDIKKIFGENNDRI